MFIDMHCHILPGVDDGAESFEKACELIIQGAESGTTVMTVTPHYNNPDKQNGKYNKQLIADAYKQLKSALKNKDIPVTLLLGSEILADNNLGVLQKNDGIIPINGSRYILVEFHFDEDIRNVHRYVDEIISFGLIPVLAHPERYSFFLNEDIEYLVNKGCKIQINKDSPLGKYGTSAQRFSHFLLKNDLVHLIASDCHDVNYRNADMSDIYKWLSERFTAEKIAILTHDNPKSILLDRNI